SIFATFLVRTCLCSLLNGWKNIPTHIRNAIARMSPFGYEEKSILLAIRPDGTYLLQQMNNVAYFGVGETYTNDQIRFSLDLENLGGIRPSLDSNRNLRHVAVLTAAEDSERLQTENPYHDRIEGDVLIYTAQGREGDQALTGRNKRLVEQYGVPTPFFGFVNIGRQTYRFLGIIELLR